MLMAAGLAACDGVEAAAGFRPRLKWPNDLVVDDRKLAGLLTEVDARRGSRRHPRARHQRHRRRLSGRNWPATATSCEEEATAPGRPGRAPRRLPGRPRVPLLRRPGWRRPGGDAGGLPGGLGHIGRRVRVELPPPRRWRARPPGGLETASWSSSTTPAAEHVVNAGDVKHLRSSIGEAARSNVGAKQPPRGRGRRRPSGGRRRPAASSPGRGRPAGAVAVDGRDGLELPGAGAEEGLVGGGEAVSGSVISSAAMPSRSARSRISARVTPRRQPDISGGVRSTPPVTTNTLVPVPSHRSPRVLAKIASPAPASLATASARTFSP